MITNRFNGTILRFASLGLLATLTSCATVTRGTTSDVVINYSPADAKVVTSLNHTCNASPCLLTVSRKKTFTVTASKPGFETQTVFVGTKVTGNGAAGIAGNVLIGGVVGIGVDAATGAARDHFPNPVNITLQPKGSAPAARPAPKASSDTPTS
ncbi:MAG: translation initiation factor 2 [Pseudomonadota bacterium]